MLLWWDLLVYRTANYIMLNTLTSYLQLLEAADKQCLLDEVEEYLDIICPFLAVNTNPDLPIAKLILWTQ